MQSIALKHVRRDAVGHTRHLRQRHAQHSELRRAAIVQAIGRATMSNGDSVYRVAAAASDEGTAMEPAFVAWAQKIVPSAAPFVAALRAKTALPPVHSPTADARRLVAGVRN